MYSAWSEVWSGVPQGSVLGLMLFVCYTNDLPEAIASCLNMYADDMKMFRKIDSKIDSAALQRDLDELGRWAEKWQLRFNTDKCQLMHLGTENKEEEYIMVNQVNGNEDKLLQTNEEKDIVQYGLIKRSSHQTM